MQEIVMPLTRLHLQWRPNEQLTRIIRHEYIIDPDAEPLFDWIDYPEHAEPLRGLSVWEVNDNDVFAVLGEHTDQGVTVDVDGRELEVSYLGPLWAAEFRGAGRHVTARWPDGRSFSASAGRAYQEFRS